MKLFFLSTVVFVTLLISFMNHGGIGNNTYALIPITNEAEIYADIAKYNNSLALASHAGEPKIYGRVARSKLYGTFSDGGLLGFCNGGVHLTGSKQFTHQLSCYQTGKCQIYDRYESQSGGQAFIYSLINKFYGNPIIFRIFCASFLSAVLVFWFVWLYDYFGATSSLLILLGILSFRSLMLLGDNIAHVFAATYLIMVALFWTYKKKIKNVGTVAFFVVLLKLLLNGPEYLFSALLLPFLPLVFYAVLNKMSNKRILSNILSISSGVLLACLVSLLILMVQVSITTSCSEAIHHFINRIMARTYFPNLLSDTHMHLTQRINLLQLLHMYLSFPCLSIGSFQVSFNMIILFFFIISILAFHLFLRYQQRILLALLITTWTSILCPLSWILIAKGHSVVHTFVDQIIWHIPFTLLGITLTVVTLQTYIKKRLPE